MLYQVETGAMNRAVKRNKKRFPEDFCFQLTEEEFDKKLAEIMRTESWIIDGNYGRTIEVRMKYCDTVFLLDYPLDVCLEGAKSRVGVQREEIPWVEEKFDEEFRQWIIDFPRTKLPQIYKLLEQYGEGKEIHIFKSRDDANKYLETGI